MILSGLFYKHQANVAIYIHADELKLKWEAEIYTFVMIVVAVWGRT